MRWKRAPSAGLACSQSNRCWPFSASNAVPPVKRAVEPAPDVGVIFGQQRRGGAHRMRRVRGQQPAERRQREAPLDGLRDDAHGGQRAQQAIDAVRIEAVRRGDLLRRRRRRAQWCLRTPSRANEPIACVTHRLLISCIIFLCREPGSRGLGGPDAFELQKPLRDCRSGPANPRRADFGCSLRPCSGTNPERNAARTARL